MSFVPHGTPASSSAVKWKNNPLQILYYSFNARKPRKTENHKKFNTCSALPWISPRHPLPIVMCKDFQLKSFCWLCPRSFCSVQWMGWDGMGATHTEDEIRFPKRCSPAHASLVSTVHNQQQQQQQLHPNGFSAQGDWSGVLVPGGF